MKNLVTACLLLALVVGCRCDDEAGAAVATSSGGIEFTHVYIPNAEDVAVQVAWPSNWAFEQEANQAVPYLGAELMLVGGAEGYPAGEVEELFADLNADGRLWWSGEYLHGELVVPKVNLDAVVGIVNLHLVEPKLDEVLFDQLQDGYMSDAREATTQPGYLGFDALRWATLGDLPLRDALTVRSSGHTRSATLDEIGEWRQRTIGQSGASVVIAGDLAVDEAGSTIDALFERLPSKQVDAATKNLEADFSTRRILLHVPGAQTSTLILTGPLPPTREGGEMEDMLLVHALGGDEHSALFRAIRTGLRASYGFDAYIDAYHRDLRFLVLSGEVETEKLSEAEDVARKAYAQFRSDPPTEDLRNFKDWMRGVAAETAENPRAASFGALMSLLDGEDPQMVLRLSEAAEELTEDSLRRRTLGAYPEVDKLTVLAVSPDATALPGACVITSPSDAAGC